MARSDARDLGVALDKVHVPVGFEVCGHACSEAQGEDLEGLLGGEVVHQFLVQGAHYPRSTKAAQVEPTGDGELVDGAVEEDFEALEDRDYAIATLANAVEEAHWLRSETMAGP